MTTKVVEVLAQILDGLNKNFSLEDVNSKLTNDNKFDKQTVSAAFSLIYDKILKSTGEKIHDQKPSKNFRILNDEEKEMIGLEYYDYLMHLQNIGLLDPDDTEMLLEQIMLFPNHSITFEDINWMILVSLVDYNTKILPGSRVILYSTDKIN
ncbi:MAG: DUF494 domain-containing protein [Chlorobi bacterium]|nr:DUF494 domain-containing protein [Chlorobiota bacterium]